MLPSRTEEIGIQYIPVDSMATTPHPSAMSQALNLNSSGKVVPNSAGFLVPAEERMVATIVFLWISAPQCFIPLLTHFNNLCLIWADGKTLAGTISHSSSVTHSCLGERLDWLVCQDGIKVPEFEQPSLPIPAVIFLQEGYTRFSSLHV
jgi:hypothetical protein